MAPFTSVLCAIDSSALAYRVLYHAIGVAGACDAVLTVATAVSGDTGQVEAGIRSRIAEILPDGAPYPREIHVRVVQLAMGEPVDSILRAAKDGAADLLVMGTHSRTGLSRWLLGSASAALLAQAPCPTLLVPPGQVNVVTLGSDAARFTPGAVMAAIDLTENNYKQVALAGEVTRLAGAPLVAMTVADAGLHDDDADRGLREQVAAQSLTPLDRVVVRRGAVAEAIDSAAADVQAGLIVMGLRTPGHGLAGENATAVLKTKDAVLLAVPA